MASICSPANQKTCSSSVHTHTCLGNTGVNVATVTIILYHKSYKLSIHYPWKWTQTFMVRSQWLSYDRAGTHNVLYTNPHKNLGGIQSRPLGGHGEGTPLPVYWPGNWACSTVYADTQNSGITNSITVLLQDSTTKCYMLCYSPLMPVMFQFVGVTKYVFFKPKISLSDTLYFAHSVTNEQIRLFLNSTNCLSLLKYVNGQCLSKFSKESLMCHRAADIVSQTSLF